ncbi:MAG TPA: FHA domain-containing protein [Vicinamibacteria bacterium]|nr:FHA domain-containing protein [Vicinamibacteria bacterium]
MAIVFGDLSLDVETRQLLRGGKEIHLSPKAFQLLELLVAERPRALTKAEIRDRLWPNTFVSESSLTGLVTTLRDALRDRARDPRLLRTVHGLGYAFCGVVTEAAPRRKSTARQVRFRLTWEGGEVPLAEGENVLGRVEEAAAWIESASVSRRHARIVVSEGEARLEDMGSKNGTFLNGRKITSAEPLSDGDEIRLGLEAIRFRMVGGATSTKTAKG